ncbi:MAG: polymer-forming cytoskeletal protein [Rhodospirillaceae bacterium]|jgi:cytoskeletal protein CcmA (bactofilin family)|nr:polymer-forming cytoskeletal protein [Rhodospirillaceae bacterium]MBT4940858.1 polymer-forming cytoskeletal protein [Rhodospirillaceae bacterium]MBT5940608.1 polymer-forming cytoskeletal protein [Rhodospirillaceae bacterium]MBT7268675.1 polymer-forming cytoskeletal protein [Rhodospirillaceae bacterium]
MFTKGSKEDEKNLAPKVPSPPSLLSTDLEITGNLHSHGEIQIDGIVNGDIHSDVLIVGETAQVNGEISADSVRVHGHVTGQIKANSVSLAKTAHVLGDILHGNLAIEQGAFLEGHCRRIESEKKSSEGAINLLVKGGSKNKTEQPPKKPLAETA